MAVHPQHWHRLAEQMFAPLNEADARRLFNVLANPGSRRELCRALYHRAKQADEERIIREEQYEESA
jgi:hypothetical protein